MSAYLAMALVAGGAVVLGQAACRACGLDTRSAAVVGLALLLALASLVVEAGAPLAAPVVCLLAVAAAALWLARTRRLRPDAGAAAAAIAAGAIVSLQFLSAGRIGLPGMSLNNDTAVHLLWAEGLRSDLMSRLYPVNPGYPLGPHSLMVLLAEGTGIGMDRALIGVLLATPVLFAVTAAAALRSVPVLLRVPAAVCVSLSYLSAAWLAQGAFKEPMLALFLLGFALGIGDLLRRGAPVPALAAVPVGLVAAGAVLVYSYLALAWLAVAGALGVALVAFARQPTPRELAAAARAAAVPVLLGGLAALAAVAVELPRLWRYLRLVGTSPTPEGEIDLGNLAGPLSARAALAIWPAGDFRFPPPPEAFMLSELKLLALVAVLGGAAWLVGRGRDLDLVAALGAAALAVALSDDVRSPYLAAKALAVLAPFTTLVALRALLPDGIPAAAAARVRVGAGVAVAAVLMLGALWSSERVLRSSPVESAEQRDELAELRPVVEPGPTLFLGVDDYAGWRLREMPLGYVGVGHPPPIAVATRAEKPFEYGRALDWDSVDAATLDQFRYVVTTRGPYASAAPPNFRLARSTPLFEAWERTGPTAPRATLDPPDAPAAALDCEQDPAARGISRQRGVAAVEPGPPVVLHEGLPPLTPGAAVALPASLPRGTWELAVRYTSPVSIRLAVGSARARTLPPNTGRPGPWWPAGTVRSRGRGGTLVVEAERETPVTRSAFPAFVSAIVAVRPGMQELIPLRRACGRVVDWYVVR